MKKNKYILWKEQGNSVTHAVLIDENCMRTILCRDWVAEMDLSEQRTIEDRPIGEYKKITCQECRNVYSRRNKVIN